MAAFCSESSSRHWQKVINKNLGFQKRWMEFSLDIKAVDLGLKPGFLFDYSAQIASSLQKLILGLRFHNLLLNNLMIVSCCETNFIISQETLKVFLLDFEMNSNKYVIDITKNPVHFVGERINSELKLIIRKINLQLDFNSRFGDNSNVPLEISCDLRHFTTLLGIFCGYPVPYWIDLSTEKTTNSLCMSSLNIHVVLANVPVSWNVQTPCKTQGLNKYLINQHEIYNFSIPAQFMDNVQERVSVWFERIRLQCSQQYFFSDISLHSFISKVTAIVV